MLLRKQMKDLQGLTQREQDICNYIMEHPDLIGTMSSRELGHATFTSAASVTRFCQKLGLKGYPEFKLKFVSELNTAETNDPDEKIQMSRRENTVTMVRKVTELQRRAVEETKREISFDQLIRVERMISNAKYIDFFAYDANVYLAQYGCNQFFHAGKIANVYSATNIQGLLASMPTEDHLSILISHTGENSRLFEIAKILRKKGAKFIVIASGHERTLAKFADEFLYASAPKGVEEFWTPMFFSSGKYLLDILFGLEFSSRYEENIHFNSKYEKSGRNRLWGLINEV